MTSLLCLCLAGGVQVDPDLAPLAVNKEIERFQAEYVRLNGLTPTPQELAAWRERLPAQGPGESEASRKFRERFIYTLVANYKLQKDLYGKHGGKVVLSAFGFMVARDAMSAEWRLWEREGRWRFASDKLRSEVFEYLDKMSGDGSVEGKQARELFSQPFPSVRQ